MSFLAALLPGPTCFSTDSFFPTLPCGVFCFSCSIPPAPPPPPPHAALLYTTPSTQHHLHNIMNTTPSTQHHNTTPSTQHHQHNTINTTSSTQHHQHYTIYTASSKTTSVSFCLAGAAPGAGTRSTSREVRESPATIVYYGRQLLLRGRCSTWSTSVSFCVAGAALGASHCHFAWQV